MTKATVLHDRMLDEKVYRRVFPSGLTAYVVRKKEFTRSYATLATRFGSIDTTLRVRGKVQKLPDGVAHFLEHKIFETADGDAFDLFAARGASPNAFTSFNSTRYLFGTSTDYAGNLRVLLDMVFELHVDDENVEKEKGIICQEIAMYDDDPNWRLYFGGLEALYSRNPVRIDIAGTAETIAGIDPELLRRIHRSYYHPRNMVLSAVSSAPVNETFRAVEECVEGRQFGPPPGRRRPPPKEARAARTRQLRVKLPVARPRLLLACKDALPGGGGLRLLRRELVSTLVLDSLFGNSGSVFLELYERGLVDDGFSASYTADPSFAFAMIGGETDEVPRLKRALEKEIAAALKRGLSQGVFERMRNKVLGDYARAFNAPERIAHMLVGHHMRGTALNDYREILYRITRPELNRRMRELLDPAVRCYSIVEPR